MKENKMLKIIKIFVISILSIVILVNAIIIIQTKINPNSVPSIFGYKPFIVLSGSMESKINTGDLVIIEKTNVDKLKKGDIIAFRDSENLVTTHRIVRTFKQNNDTCFNTKGDANNAEDNDIVCSKQIEGKYKFKIAKLGHVLLFIQKPLGFTVMMMSLLVVGLIIYIISGRKNTKELLFKDENELREYEEFRKQRNKD